MYLSRHKWEPENEHNMAFLRLKKMGKTNQLCLDITNVLLFLPVPII